QAIVQAEIRNYAAQPKDLDYPSKLKDAVMVVEPQKGEQKEEDDGSLKMPTLEPESSWYPPLVTTCNVLKKLHDYVKPGIFQDISQEAISLCRLSILSAADLIVARPETSEVDAHLFVIRHLLALKEITSAVENATTDHEVASQPPSDVLGTLLRGTSSLFNPSGLLGGMLGNTRQGETLSVARTSIDEDLKRSCELLITKCADGATAPLTSFITKCDNFSKSQPNTLLSTQDFAQPAAISGVQDEFRSTCEKQMLEWAAHVRLYLRDDSTIAVLLPALHDEISSTFTAFRKTAETRCSPGCDGCQDVVKKPKLDSHGVRCHASFTCIDCSKTFAGPAQWKSHTSCMSEEQKYHKSVYQGLEAVDGGVDKEAEEAHEADLLAHHTHTTNAWTAPPADPVNNAPFDSTEWIATVESTIKPTVVPRTDPPNQDLKESKKSKKRKTEDLDVDETAAAAPPQKKKKKEDSLPVPGSVPEPAAEPTTEPTVDKDMPKKKKKSRGLEVTDQSDVTADGAVNDKEKKAKKSRKSQVLAIEDPTADSEADPLSTPLSDQPTKSKKKSRKSETKADEPIAPVESTTNLELATIFEPATNGHSADKKSKKDKKDKKSKAANLNGNSVSAAPNEPPSAPDANDLIPVSTIEPGHSEPHLGKKERQKKAKKEKKEQAKAEAKAREAKTLASEPPAAQDEVTPVDVHGATPKPNKSSEDTPKQKKKKSKRDKESREIVVA
ncbi:Golgi transport complex subunit 3, partial [Ceratobasidium sp. 392]